MTEKDIEKMLAECDGLDMSHIEKDNILAKAKQEIYFGAEATEQKKEKSSFPLLFTKKRLIPMIAGAALAFTICIGMIGVYNENFQTVYIDINPSVALKLNRFERVIGVEFLNEDAKALLSDTKLVGCDAKAALQTVIDACDSAGYVKDDSEIYISAAAKEEKTSEKLLKKLKGHAEAMREDDSETYSVNTYNAKKGEKKEFEKESLSPAKYNAIKEIIDEDGRYKLDDLKNKPMSELQKIRHELDDDDDDWDDDREHGEFDDDDRDDGRPDDKPNGRPNENDKPSQKPEKELEGNDDRDDDRDDDDDDDREHRASYGKQ